MIPHQKKQRDDRSYLIIVALAVVAYGLIGLMRLLLRAT